MAEAPTHKQRTRARILDEAASAMRTHGIDGIGVATLMKRAGLTQGGFYAHFASRDDLVAHAIDRMFEDSKAMVARYLDGKGPAEGLAMLIDGYLSDRARLAPERSCPIPSISSEAARLPGPARERFNQGVARFEKAISDRLAALNREDPEGTAASALAEMIGAMALARSIDEKRKASAMLSVSRERLKARLDL